MLVDSGHLQEEDAKHMHGHEAEDAEHAPIAPLYTEEDAKDALPFFNVVEYDTVIDLGSSLQCTLIRSGHILGSSFVVISDRKTKTYLFGRSWSACRSYHEVSAAFERDRLFSA